MVKRKNRDKNQPVIKLINTHKAKTELSKLIRQVEEFGSSFKICRDGKPVAELRPISATENVFERDAVLSRIKFLEDPATPCDEADWPKDLR